MQSSSELMYDDFEVEIGLGRGREYPIAVLHSEAGEARGTMQFPYDELVLENRLKDLKIALLGSGGMRRTSLSPEEQTVQTFGGDLFNALITGEVRSRYDSSMEKARLNGRGLRVKLRIQPPNLAVLPWEFLYEPRQAEYMGLMRSMSIVRYPEHPQPIQPLTVTLPLRILGMVASPIDLPRLDIENEKQRVEEALKKLQENGYVELTWLEGQTWRDLQKAMLSGPWHIFHFIGHGGFDRNTDEGIIALADEEGRTHRFSARQLSTLLADHHSLRLVILNSCEGARGNERDLTSSTASILIRRGIPAVLAMQYKITDRAAIEFARTFYETLADGLPVDAAVAEARRAISIEVANTVEWGMPVLYMRSPDGVLFSIQKKKKAKGRKRVIEEPIAREEKEPLEQERREREARQIELSALYSKGTEALAAQDWQTAIGRFKEVLVIDAGYWDASARLKEAERQSDLVREKEKSAKEAKLKAQEEAERLWREKKEEDRLYWRFCPRCGTQNMRMKEFCRECGTRLYRNGNREREGEKEKKESKPVLLGASAPRAVKPGDIFTARFVAYIKAVERIVEKELVELSYGRSETHLGMSSSHWHLDTRVTVKLSGRYLKVNPSKNNFVWKGNRNLVNFVVEVLPDAPEEWTVLCYEVFIDGFRVAFIPLDLEITSKILSNKQNTATAQPARTAFASYASQDIGRVLDRVAAVRISAGLDIFMDCLSLHPGEEWKPRLEQEIKNRDLFLLFWSLSAKKSEWVTWEWKTALSQKGDFAMQLHPLQTVTEAPPPEELRKLHFGDVYMLVRETFDSK